MKIFATLTVALLTATPAAWTQERAASDGLMRKMAALVLTHNPILLSQSRLIEEGRRIVEPGDGFAIPGMTLGAGLGIWNPYTNSFAVTPSVTFGLSFSFSDPTRGLNVLKIKEEKELAKQQWETAKNTTLAQLFSKIRDIQKLKSQGRNLASLKKYLEDYSSVAQSQRIEQAIGPDKLWELKERLTNLDIDLQTLDGQLETTMLETAMSLGGDAWEDLLQLLRELDG